MAKHHALEKVLVDVFCRDRKYFANVGWFQSRHSLGPANSRDEIYQLVYSFISDLRLVSEIHQKHKPNEIEGE